MVKNIRSKAKKAANQIIEDFSIKKAPINLDEIAERKGIRVVYSDALQKDDISGMMYHDDGCPVIVINKSHGTERKRFTFAHELGHYHLHQSGNFVDRENNNKVNFRNSRSGLAIDNKEIEANTFAANLLMPKELLRESAIGFIEKNPSSKVEDLIPELAEVFQVSPLAMEYRLKNCGFIDPNYGCC